MEWKAIPGWEGMYEVSTTGRVRSVDRVISTDAKHGYRYIHRVGVVITGRGKYITIEVSK